MRWYHTDLPFLEGTTLINMREYGPDTLQEYRVGELPMWAANRNYNGRWTMPAGLTGKHVCERRWFATGEPWPTSLPETKYDDFWIPLCCGNFDHLAEGGFEIGGPLVHEYRAYHSPTGGFVIGGAVVHNVAFTHAPTGGFVIGGAVVHAVAFTHAPTGGFVIGGAQVHDFVFHHAPTGGVEVGGEVVHVPTYEDAPTGGVEVGGEVVHAVAFPHTPTGGIEVGGQLVHAVGIVHAPAGGAVIGGAVVHRVAVVHAPAGGGALGGAVVHAVAFHHAPAGGGALGGAVVHAVGFKHAPTGGVVLGGGITHTFNPGTVTPGTSCATAGVCSLGTTYSSNAPLSPAADWWRIPSLTNGVTYYIVTTGLAISGPFIQASEGTTCGGATSIGLSNPHAGCWSFTKTGTNNLYLKFFKVSGGTAPYSFNVSTTPC